MSTNWYRYRITKVLLWVITSLIIAWLGFLVTFRIVMDVEQVSHYIGNKLAIKHLADLHREDIALRILENYWNDAYAVDLYGMDWVEITDITNEDAPKKLLATEKPPWLDYECTDVVIDCSGSQPAGWPAFGSDSVYRVSFGLRDYAELPQILFGISNASTIGLYWFASYYADDASPFILCCWLALALVGMVLLCRGAGRKPHSEEVHPGLFTKLPYDVFCALMACGTLGGVFLLACSFGLPFSSYFLTGFRAACLVIAFLWLLWLTDTAVRYKQGGIWRSALCVRLLKFIQSCFGLVWQLPLVPAVGAGVLLVVFAEAAGIFIFRYHPDFLILCWAVEKLVLVPLVLWVALACRRLHFGAQRIAQGDTTPIDTKGLYGALQQHAETLNAIGHSTDMAVSQRVKSEHFRTQLITNVTHDLKTPLTSIINYADLICREEPGSKNIPQYAQVLHRQSEKLKKLLEDILEASKASTGNLKNERIPCQLNVLLEQAAGEYEQRMNDQNLTVVMQLPEQPVTILADGRHLWRVFDNLLNNICKYAMPGTRVYLALAQQGEQAVVSFRNISAEPLEQDAETLLQRFSRGDSARRTEGSGLGLNIAQSLTELQEGTLELTLDGDLFKVTLSFPLQSL